LKRGAPREAPRRGCRAIGLVRERGSGGVRGTKRRQRRDGWMDGWMDGWFGGKPVK
jgi:hypothetical protein